MIKILVVDDSAFMRKILSDLFSAEPDFTVVDVARNGKDAIAKIKELKPNVVTMDVEMPVMDGLSALEVIMHECPTPVVMVSSLTREGADATLRALSLGAVDFVAKSAGPIFSSNDIKADILQKCRAAIQANVLQLVKPRHFSKPAVGSTNQVTVGTDNNKVIAIGTSTGGPRALQEIIAKLPGDLSCGVVIVQHMPPGFTKSLAERLNSLSSLTVKEAEHNDMIMPGKVFIAPGDYHMVIEQEGTKKIIKLNQQPPIGGHRPAVDPMFESVAKCYGSKSIGVILTGMGHDGSKGLKAIREQKGYIIAEDKSTAVVFGMPKSAIELGVVDKVVPLNDVATEIVKAVSR